jgi:hypothetical protein
MDDKRIQGDSKDPFEKFRISEIERKKKSDENEEEKKEVKEEKNFITSALGFVFKKISDFFSRQEETGKLKISFVDAIKKLKDNLEKLEKSDIYEESKYLKDISDSWKYFLSSYEINFLKNNNRIEEIDSLIDGVNKYFADQEYSLGYYLNHYREESWHPFPFIAILKALKKEYLDKKSAPIFKKALHPEKEDRLENVSFLQKWIIVLSKYV